MKTLHNRLVLFMVFLIVSTILNAQIKSISSREYFAEEQRRFSLNDVFQKTQISSQSKIIIQELSNSEKNLIDPDATPPVIGVVRKFNEPIAIASSNQVIPDGYKRSNEEEIF